MRELGKTVISQRGQSALKGWFAQEPCERAVDQRCSAGPVDTRSLHQLKLNKEVNYAKQAV